MAQSVDKLTPDDPRVEHHTLEIRGYNWHYLLANPTSGKPTGTVLLVHGWPDLAFGWRYQVPALLALNMRVIVPDMLGYGRTDAPDDVAEYAQKKLASDLAALAAHVVGTDDGGQVVLGGHDWGGAIVWRTALWRPEFVRAVFSVCTPYGPPRDQWVPPEVMVETVLPNFRYQLQLAGPDVEAQIVGPVKLRQFLNTLFLGRTPDGQPGFNTKDGLLFDRLESIGPSPVLSPEEVEFYVAEYARHGLHGPLNYYRTHRVNFDDELELAQQGAERTRIKVPSMIVTASRDGALPPSMAANMDRHFESLVKREVDATHWALWEAAGDVNKTYFQVFAESVAEGYREWFCPSS
ncbi:putative epoxide hydrolase [Echria macrotheca]|uniref:Epoxide hydrolase n=1 Tax=Echria macrotheca TaxID=438768 RepID=A0AAJ0B4P8_9PEZI|nr:putative epoxide hydrolase [Echria macrotheca]